MSGMPECGSEVSPVKPRWRARHRLLAGLCALTALAVLSVLVQLGTGERDAGPSALAAELGLAAGPVPSTPASHPAWQGHRLIAPAVTAPPAAAPAAVPTSALTPVPPPPPTTKPAAARQQPVLPAASVSSRQASRSGCDVGAAAGARQVVVVRSSGTRATVRACSRTANGSYALDLGPYRGYVGRSGVTSAGAKREGDGATPAGVYPLRGGFGLRANPGIPQGWFRVDGDDVWVDDPDSALYNTHQTEPADGRWSSAEQLANPPAYDYAQVIGYNESRRPGRGSAIFLHVATGGPTAGCVSLPVSALLEVMRWERSGVVIAVS